MRTVAVLCTIGLVASCAADDEQPASTSATSPVAESGPATTDPGTTVPDVSTSVAPISVAPTTGDVLAGAAALCARTGTAEAGPVRIADLTEASGLVASRTHPGVFWTHNDGSDARLFAVGEDGAELGVFDLGVDVTDVEDIALVAGDSGFDLLLADIGDNGRERSSIRLLRVPEPDPSRPGELEAVQTLELVYPDGPHNAEALLVDETNGVLVIVTKEQDESGNAPEGLGATLPALVFEGPLDPAGDGPTELVAVGTIDLPALQSMSTRAPAHPVELFGAAGVVTGGDVAPDGSMVALRTYQTIWLWDRLGDQPLAEALGGEPCEVAVEFERQGEAVAFAGGGLATLGEGSDRLLHLLAR